MRILSLTRGNSAKKLIIEAVMEAYTLKLREENVTKLVSIHKLQNLFRG